MAEDKCYACGEDLSRTWTSAKHCKYCGHVFCDNHLNDYVCPSCQEKRVIPGEVRR